MNYTYANKQGTKIVVRNNDVEKAIKALRHVSLPIIKEVKQLKFHEKKCDKRRRKEKESIIRVNRIKKILSRY